MNNYQEMNVIGKGTSGLAIRARDRRNQRIVVIKRIGTCHMNSLQRKEALNEVDVLRSLHHGYIVKHYDSFLERNYLNIVMEYAEGGDLSMRIRKCKTERATFTEDLILRWFSQITLGLAYMHSKNVMHRDLKPQNFSGSWRPSSHYW
jgi:NIMA (never in mitosis gene a)-related kinase 1/4/5